MSVLMYGSTTWTNEWSINLVVDGYYQNWKDDWTLIEGAAPGADRIAGRRGKEHYVYVEEYPADWTKYGKPAGVIRNQEMVDQHPEEAWGFINDPVNSRGSKDTTKRLVKAGIPGFVVVTAEDMVKLCDW